jgi:tripartite-type tricarboxylate transporter receptor subunit TctC
MLRLFAVLVLVVVTSPAAAQDSWPAKPITVIVPFGAGGNTDSLARIYSARLSARLGQQFVIENRVGAGSIIGITSLAKAAPDGYTIGVGTSAGLAINPAIMKENLGYNADKDFAYLHLMAIQPNLLVVHPSVPARNLAEFIAWVKANPDQAYATSGNGSKPVKPGTGECFRFAPESRPPELRSLVSAIAAQGSCSENLKAGIRSACLMRGI